MGASSLAPGDLATIYDINPLYRQGVNGTGQKIAIVGQSAVDISDIQQFRAIMGWERRPQITFVQNGTPGTDPGDLIEADLDLEWAGAIAPNAALDLCLRLRMPAAPRFMPSIRIWRRL